jgi:hypothetical protein
MKTVLLDSGPLSLAAQRKGKPEADRLKQWMQRMIAGGADIIVPAICDYEVRRELIRAGKTASVSRLDALHTATEYIPLTKAVLVSAAELWATSRQSGRPTAHPLALDGDVILAAQALSLSDHRGEVVVATTNIGHLDRFVAAALWTEIEP